MFDSIRQYRWHRRRCSCLAASNDDEVRSHYDATRLHEELIACLALLYIYFDIDIITERHGMSSDEVDGVLLVETSGVGMKAYVYIFIYRPNRWDFFPRNLAPPESEARSHLQSTY